MCSIKPKGQGVSPAPGKGDPVPHTLLRALPGAVSCGDVQCLEQDCSTISSRLMGCHEEAMKSWCYNDKVSPPRHQLHREEP